MKTKFAILFNCTSLPNLTTFKKQLGQVRKISRIDSHKRPPSWIGIKNIHEFSKTIKYISIVLNSSERSGPACYELYAFSNDANLLILQLSKPNHIAYTFEADDIDIKRFMDDERCFNGLISASQSMHSTDKTLCQISEKLNFEDAEKVKLKGVTVAISPSAEFLYNLSVQYLKRMELLLKTNWKTEN